MFTVSNYHIPLIAILNLKIEIIQLMMSTVHQPPLVANLTFCSPAAQIFDLSKDE
jgi:hypothetical protein